MATRTQMKSLILSSLCLLLVCPQIHAANECATTCHEVSCDTINIRYGKYCGVGHGGCPGQKPCDAVDACCKKHDECVDKHSVTSAACHQTFIDCLDKREASGKLGFSKVCPYSQVIPVMRAGIQAVMTMSSMFSNLGGGLGGDNPAGILQGGSGSGSSGRARKATRRRPEIDEL